MFQCCYTHGAPRRLGDLDEALSLAARFLSDPAHGEAHGEADDAHFPGEDDLKLLLLFNLPLAN